MKKPVNYTIEPAKGQALLSFQGRRLPERMCVPEKRKYKS